MSVRGYELLADWSRQGTFANALEDLTAYIADDPELFVSYGRDQSQATTVATAGKLTFALNNIDQSFSSENPSSPITGKVVPGTPVKLLVTHQLATRALFAGILDQFDVDPQAPAKTFTAEVLDATVRGAEPLSTELYSGLRTGDAIGLVLDAIAWPGDRDLDPGATVMPWWWEEGTDPVQAIEKLVASEGPPAIAYVKGGVFVFRDRHHRLLRTESQTSQAAFTHAIPAGSGPIGSFMIRSNSFSYDHGLRHIVNTVNFSVDQREPGGITEVWSTDAPTTFADGQTKTIIIETSDPFFNAITPVADVDYDVTGIISVSLSRTSGQATTLTITASGGPAIITRLALRAVSVPVVRTVDVLVEDTASISKHTTQPWPGQVPPFANVYDADAIARRIIATYATNRPVVTFQITNLDDDYMTQILDRCVSDRIRVINDSISLDVEFIIERITHSIRKLGMIHSVEFSCQVVDPAQPENIFTFDVAGKGFNDGAFGIDGIDNADNTLMFDVAGRGFNDGVFAT